VILALLARWIAPHAATVILAGAAIATVAGFLFGVRRSGRLAERAEQAARTAEVQRAQLQATVDRPADRATLSERMRAGRF
jgi:hypothetical protein